MSGSQQEAQGDPSIGVCRRVEARVRCLGAGGQAQGAPSSSCVLGSSRSRLRDQTQPSCLRGVFPRSTLIVLTLALISGTSLHAVSHASPPPGFSYWLKSYIFTVFLLAALKVNMHPVVLNLNVGSICIKNMNWSRLLCFASAPRRVRGGVAAAHSLLRTHLGAFTGCRKPRRGQLRHNLVSQS